MTDFIKGALGYITPNKNSPETAKDVISSPVSDSPSVEDESKEKEVQQGYLKRAVSGITSGVYSVGSSTVGVGVNGVKWIAGTTYNVGSGVVGTVGSVAGSAAGTVAGVVGSGASTVLSKVSRSAKSKEHKD